MITVTITSPRQIAGINAAASAAGEEPDAYLQRIVEAAAESYRGTHAVDRISSADFVLRFTPDEIDAITLSQDEMVTGFMGRVRSEPYVWLASDEVQAGMNYLVSQSLMTAERLAEITTY